MHATAHISQSALAHNLERVKACAPRAKIAAMVKANGYGHHVNLIRRLFESVDYLAVSSLTEARRLRTQTTRPILLLCGVYSAAELRDAIALNCHIVLHEPSQIALINATKKCVNIWLKIDTGMHRLGLSGAQFQTSLAQLEQNPRVKIQCVMSHFACADAPEHPMNTAQLRDFNALTSDNYPRSMANSAACLANKSAHFEIVRPGIMLYGVSPFGEIDASLKPVMRLSAPIMAIKSVKIGETVGYGNTWTARKNTHIAIIGIGYGDGYPRHAKNGTPVLIRDKLCALAGRVSMDLIAVDIGDLSATIGDEACLWGDAKLRVETIAACSDTIGYELLTGVSARVNFVQIP